MTQLAASLGWHRPDSPLTSAPDRGGLKTAPSRGPCVLPLPSMRTQAFQGAYLLPLSHAIEQAIPRPQTLAIHQPSAWTQPYAAFANSANGSLALPGAPRPRSVVAVLHIGSRLRFHGGAPGEQIACRGVSRYRRTPFGVWWASPVRRRAAPRRAGRLRLCGPP